MFKLPTINQFVSTHCCSQQTFSGRKGQITDSQKINTDQIYHSPKWAEWYYISSSPGHSPPKSALFGWEWPGDEARYYSGADRSSDPQQQLATCSSTCSSVASFIKINPPESALVMLPALVAL